MAVLAKPPGATLPVVTPHSDATRAPTGFAAPPQPPLMTVEPLKWVPFAHPEPQGEHPQGQWPAWKPQPQSPLGPEGPGGAPTALHVSLPPSRQGVPGLPSGHITDSAQRPGNHVMKAEATTRACVEACQNQCRPAPAVHGTPTAWVPEKCAGRRCRVGLVHQNPDYWGAVVIQTVSAWRGLDRKTSTQTNRNPPQRPSPAQCEKLNSYTFRRKYGRISS